MYSNLFFWEDSNLKKILYHRVSLEQPSETAQHRSKVVKSLSKWRIRVNQSKPSHITFTNKIYVYVHQYT